jgi:hypothetical protein
MGARGVVVIDLTEETDGMEKKEVKKEGHTCRCEVCHCDDGGAGGCEAGAIRHDSLIPYVRLSGTPGQVNPGRKRT